jgi:hypothetical protein
MPALVTAEADDIAHLFKGVTGCEEARINGG